MNYFKGVFFYGEKRSEVSVLPFSLKMQAIQMRLEGVTKRDVAEKLGIHDVGRWKVWMRQYKQKGAEGLRDHRGGRKKPLERDEYVHQLELENDVLKKWLEIRYKGGIKAKYQWVQALRGRYTVQELCDYLKISRSGFYRHLQCQSVNGREKELKENIRHICPHRKGRYGYRRIQVELERQYGIRVNHKRGFRLMQDMGLKALICRKLSSRPGPTWH